MIVAFLNSFVKIQTNETDFKYNIEDLEFQVNYPFLACIYSINFVVFHLFLWVYFLSLSIF
ncbi:MAG: hypothetical protein DSY76_01030 [Bacteroidetes bacterium]|nr:MAG: hypothetical protein DSY76_01030 [Bacteroidota bacterium]